MADGRVTLQFRRNTAEGWLVLDPILNSGEPGFERDTGKTKIGNGLQKWSDLPYLVGEDADLSTHVNDLTPHPVYDDIPSLTLLLENGML